MKLEPPAAVAIIGHAVSGATAGHFSGWSVAVLCRYRNFDSAGNSDVRIPRIEAARSRRRLFGRRLSGPQPSGLVHLRTRRGQNLPKARVPGQRRGGSEPEETGAAHAEFRRAPVDLPDQTFRKVDIDALGWIRRGPAPAEIGGVVHTLGQPEPPNSSRFGKQLAPP